MKVFYYSHELEKALEGYRQKGLSVAYVPTMGALHSGHISLIKQAKAECDIVLANIFVNPKQFNNPEDFAKYPSTYEKDIAMLEQAGCDMVFKPDVNEVYPADYQPVSLDLGIIEKVFEGYHRPGHFDGVVQVLYRLFSITKPDKAYFGLKDYQQCLLVKKLAAAFSRTLKLCSAPPCAKVTAWL